MIKIGNVKSFRTSEKAENMFEALKKYYSICGDKINDSQLILFGIENLFSRVSEKVNKDYKAKMQTKLDDKQKELFKEICVISEKLAIESGNFLEDEVKYFVCYTQRNCNDFGLLAHEEAHKMNVFQYDKVESKLLHANFSESDINSFAQFLKNYYKK